MTVSGERKLRCGPRSLLPNLASPAFSISSKLFEGWVADCPLLFTSPNAPRKRDVLGTLLLSVLAGHRRYAHVTALRCDAVNPPLLG
jgi:hypothetical protein